MFLLEELEQIIFSKSKILETSITRFLLSPKLKNLNISAIYKAIILIFQWIFLWYLSTGIVKIQSNHQENLEKII